MRIVALDEASRKDILAIAEHIGIAKTKAKQIANQV